MKTALLLSGGIDSISLAYWKRPDLAFTIDYGQTCADAEFRASSQICKDLGIEHVTISVDCSSIGSGDLAGRGSIDGSPSIEWWPYRNQLLVTLAAMRAIELNVNEILLGTVSSDGFHKDGTAEFYRRLSSLIFYQEGAISVSAPAIDMSSDELVKISGIGHDLLAWAHSCHTSNFACGFCRGCYKHREIMGALGFGFY